MNNVFDNWDDLVHAADEVCAEILTQDVAPEAIKILKKHIKADIYDVYTPRENGWVTSDGKRTTYERRHVLEDNIKAYLIEDNHTLLVTSSANASNPVVKGYRFRNRYDGAFLKLLESGRMGIWRGGFPRPAVKNTQEEIDHSKRIESAIKNGIKRRFE